MEINNCVKQVSFEATSCGNWFIKVNGSAIVNYYYSISCLTTFRTLKRAVRFAIRKGYIPKSVKASILMTDVNVTINH